MEAHIMDYTTIQISQETLKQFKAVKDSPRQTYDELIRIATQLLKERAARRKEIAELYLIQQRAFTDAWGDDNDEWTKAWANS